MRELILIRHAESEYNARKSENLDSGLTPVGIKQATAMAEYLIDAIPPDKLATFQCRVSPYLRCLQTARVIRKAMKKKINFSVDPGPREVMIFYDEFSMGTHRPRFSEMLWPDVPSWKFPKETELDFKARMRAYLMGLGAGNYLIVSHGSPVGTLADMEMGFFDKPFSHKVIKNASLTWLIDGKPILFNHIAYPDEPIEEELASPFMVL